LRVAFHGSIFIDIPLNKYTREVIINVLVVYLKRRRMRVSYEQSVSRLAQKNDRLG